MQRFHSSLAVLESILFTTWLEQFKVLKLMYVTGLCHHCDLDTDVPIYFLLKTIWGSWCAI